MNDPTASPPSPDSPGIGTVQAVSIAAPRWQEMFGRQVFSSIVREAAEGPILFEPGGPVGNATAVHTEEVFAFFAEHYDHWAAELGVDRAIWTDCFWGENLMLSGLSEARLHIGDRFRIGAAVLEVTSPRVPCFKVAWRLGQPETFVARLNDDGRMGCYLRVVTPGLIGSGDAIVPLNKAPDAISVHALSRLLADPDITDLDLLRSAAATPGIGKQAAEMLAKRLTFLIDGQLGRRHRWDGWRAFGIARIVEEAHDIRSFHLEALDGAPLADYRPGQFLTVRLPEEAGRCVRTWSLSDFSAATDHYRLTIKREQGGVASTFLHEQARVGMIVEARPPSGRFVLDRSGLLRTVLISAGIGVTPLLAMLKAHAARPDRPPPLLWLHAARSARDHALHDEVVAYLGRLPDSEARIFHSRPATDAELPAGHHAGRIDAAVIEAMLDESYAINPFGRAITLTGDASDFYICGPAGFEKMVRETLLRRGVDNASIRSESFGPAAGNDEAAYPEQAIVHLRTSDRSLIWRRDDDLSLLGLLEEAGLSPVSGCRMGVCGSCEAGIHAGSTAHRGASPHLLEGRLLLCCSRPVSERIELDL